MTFSWYVLHTYSGHENRVKLNLEQRVRAMGMIEKVLGIVGNIGAEFSDDLNENVISENLRKELIDKNIKLSENANIIVQDPGRRWLIANNRQNLMIRKENDSLIIYAPQIFVPTQEVTEYKDGKKKVSTKTSFPGYVLVRMELDDDLWYIVKSTPGVMGFVGTGLHPTPLEDQEVEGIITGKQKDAQEEEKRVIRFKISDKVKVVDGPFTGFSGVIDEINEEKSKLRLMISIFGRSTPVELEFFQIEKIQE